MTEITYFEYREQVNSIAAGLASEALADNEWDRDAAEEDINDSRLHETIDGHQWVIYTAYNLEVLRHSESEDAYIDNFGAQDVQDILSDALDEAIDEHEKTIKA